MYIRQTIELRPNNKQKTYFRQCFGARRLAYNYGLSEWIRRRDAGEKTNCRDIRTQFNTEKAAGRWPFLKEVSNSATTFAFDDLKRAFDNFFLGHDKIKKGSKDDVQNFPKPKSKSYNEGSYTEYFSSKGSVKILDHRVKVVSKLNAVGNYNVINIPIPNPSPNPKSVYLCLPRIGTVRMTRTLRYDGRPVSVTIRQHNECFYACFLVEITEEEFFRTHPRYASQPQGESVGIDLGIKGLAVTSDGLVVDNPHQWKQQLEHENHLQERMNRCGGIKQKKRERKSFRPSKRFIKAKMKLCKQRTYIRNCRQDLRNKLCGAILSSYQHIAIETLSIKRMPDSLNSRRNKKLIRNFLKEVGLYEIRRRLQTLGELIGRDVVAAPNNFYSTRTCCKCGHIEPHLNLDKRIYHCPECGNEIDRDLNAAINLRNLIGRGMSDSLPEASPMRSELIKSQIKHGVIGNGK